MDLNHTTPVTYAKDKNNLKLLKGRQKEYRRQQRILNLNNLNDSLSWHFQQKSKRIKLENIFQLKKKINEFKANRVLSLF